MIPYNLETITSTLAVSDYIKSYRDREKFLVFCTQCPRYAQQWVCPPFDCNGAISAELEQYKTAHITLTKIMLSDTLRYSPKTKEESDEITEGILREVREGLDVELLQKEQLNKGSRAFYAGNCKLCHPAPCTRLVGEPCLHPNKARPSLEALGFDLSRTAQDLLGVELKWSTTHVLPEYFCLISALFVK